MVNLEECKGYQSLKAAVERDCVDRGGTFHPQGCVGCTETKGGRMRCDHKYCDKFVWAVNRAEEYAAATGVPASDILDAWEANRDYWYMNHYQEGCQPRIKEGKVRVFGTKEEFKASLENNGFRCPKCGEASLNPQECKCGWKSYGLFGTMGKGATVFLREHPVPFEIFMPVAWEKEPAK